jgi:hypothetical protein
MLIVTTPEVDGGIAGGQPADPQAAFVQKVYRACDLRSLHWLMRIGGAVR